MTSACITNAQTIDGSSDFVALAPVISTIAPSSVPAYTAFTLTVTGSNFESGAQVRVGGGTMLATQFVSSTELTATVPLSVNWFRSSYPNSYLIAVVNADGTVSNSVTLTITNPGAVISNISPSSVSACSAFTLTVNGSGFVSGDQIRVGSSVLTTNFVSSAQLTALVPVSVNWYRSSYPNTYPITVLKPDGSVSNSVSLTITKPVCAISSISPSSVPAYSAFTLVVTGSGFVSGAQARLGANTLLTTTFDTPTQVTASVPISVNWYRSTYPSAYAIAVINPDGTISNSVVLKITEPKPVVSKISPSSVASGTAFTLTVYGSSFVSGAAIHFNGTALTTTFVSANELTATVGASQNSGYTSYPQSAPVTVTNPAGTVSNAVNETVTGTNYKLNVVDGAGSGSYAAGAVVSITANAAPSGEVFSGWTGATVADANAVSTTLTMPAAATQVTANYTQANTSIPFPVTTHPRIWMTQSDLSRLQGWAVSTNPIWQQGMKPLLAQALSVYNTYYFPGGTAASPYPDPGDTQGYAGLDNPGGPFLTACSEEWAVLLAFGSLIDPSSTNRIADAKAARNLLMYAMNLAVLGPNSNQPFQDPSFPIYNRGNGSCEDWPLIVDWIYNAKDASGNPILTTSDKATIQKVFLLWCNECENATTDGGDHPSPISVINDLLLLPGGVPYRYASNNYYLGHERLMTMMGLCIDPSDDPPVAQPASQIGNSLRSYILDANGAWLYQTYSMMGEPATIVADYGVSGDPTGAGFGLSSGGLPVEGFLYGHSYGFVLGQLLALQTAGFNNISYAGPQVKLIGDPVWDRFAQGYISSLTPTAVTPASETYLGAVYQFAGYGDMLREYVTPDMMQPFALLTLLNHENGVTKNDNATLWFVQNATPGGQAWVMSNITDPFSWGVMQSILYYMLLDPAASAPTDPRPSYPTYFIDIPQNRIVAHSDWTPNGTMFDYMASWITINHQDATGGEFELFRKGEWLTKEMSNYDNNELGMTTYYHNTLGLQNWCPNGKPTDLEWYEAGEWANGSQWMEGNNAGDPSSVDSVGQGYVYASSDLTNLYNRPNIYTLANSCTDITQATRSIIWLNNDYIVVYDRAASVHSGLFKRFNLSLVTNPAIAGHQATETMADGQQLFIQTLLPANASFSAREADTDLSPIAELEPTKYVMTVQDATNPATTRFLHVLQGADAGVAMVPAVYAQSSSGTAFDGAAFGANAIYFPVNSPASFTATVFPVQSGVTTLYVAGLTPNTSYGVVVNGTSVTVTPGGTGYTSDNAGLLKAAL
jgi:hypothetical protein